jgi:hypothetical protein
MDANELTYITSFCSTAVAAIEVQPEVADYKISFSAIAEGSSFDCPAPGICRTG